jgi:hypothetical protein
LESIKPEIISAGSWFVVDGEVQVFGPSVSLNLPSRPKDAHLIQRFLGLPLKDKVQEQTPDDYVREQRDRDALEVEINRG